MNDFIPTDRVVVADRVPTDRAIDPVFPRIAVAPRNSMTSMGPIFSSFDMAAGIAAAVMTLGPLAMAAFAVGRY
jgi:hypothetical protein